VGIKAAGCLASFILTENTRRMTPYLLKSYVPFKSNSNREERYSRVARLSDTRYSAKWRDMQVAKRD